MQILAYSPHVADTVSNTHINVGKIIGQLVMDIGEDCDLMLEFDDPRDRFSYMFSGTTLALEFDNEGIHVVDYDSDTDEEIELITFKTSELNKATHWLVTQANAANLYL